MPKVLVIIAAKGASSRVPMKNIQKVAGIPLVNYTIAHVRAMQTPCDVVVLTESTEVAETIQDIPVLIEREPDKHFYIKVRDCLLEVESQKNIKYEYVMLLGADCPLRPRGILDAAIRELANTQCDMVHSVVQVPIQYHVQRTYTIRNTGDLLPVMQLDQEAWSQQYPKHYALTGCVFAITRDYINRYAHSGFVRPGTAQRPIIHGIHEYIEIDDPEDLESFRKQVEK